MCMYVYVYVYVIFIRLYFDMIFIYLLYFNIETIYKLFRSSSFHIDEWSE